MKFLRWLKSTLKSARFGDHGGAEVVSSHCSSVSTPTKLGGIEYVIRSTDGRDWELLIGDLAVLIPQGISCEQLQDPLMLIVKGDNYEVNYSAEDLGWHLWFSDAATQLDAWSYVTAVATQLAVATEIPTAILQIAGFDGAIFSCQRAFGLKTRNIYVLEGEILAGEIDTKMNVFIPLGSSSSTCLRIDGVEFIDRSDPSRSAIGLTRKCLSWDEVEFLLSFDVHDEVVEVSHRSCSDRDKPS